MKEYVDRRFGKVTLFQNPKTEVYYTEGDWPTFTKTISTGGPEPLVEEFKSLQAVFTNMIQGILLKDDTVDNLVTIAGEELDEAL